MANELVMHADNTAGAARFARSIIGWFPEADPPEDWTKQVVICAKHFPDPVLAGVIKAQAQLHRMNRGRAFVSRETNVSRETGEGAPEASAAAIIARVRRG